MIRRAATSGFVQASEVDSALSRLRSWRGIQAAVVCSGVALMSVLAAGCGGGSGLSVASLGSTTTTTANVAFIPSANSGSQSEQLQYVQCIQRHGEPDFPEPGGTESLAEIAKKVDFGSTKFQSAMHACKNFLPKAPSVPPAEAAKIQAEALKFTNCMHANGMTNWPDPLPGGGYVPEATGAAAKSPVYQRAAKVCDPLLPKG
jgi:hypothetical protein